MKGRDDGSSSHLRTVQVSYYLNGALMHERRGTIQGLPKQETSSGGRHRANSGLTELTRDHEISSPPRLLASHHKTY